MHKFRPGLQTGAGHERRESEIDHELQSGLRDAAEDWSHGPQPSRRRAPRPARRQLTLSVSLTLPTMMNGSPIKAPAKMPKPTVERFVASLAMQCVANFTGDTLDRALRADQLQHVTAVEYGHRRQAEFPVQLELACATRCRGSRIPCDVASSSSVGPETLELVTTTFNTSTGKSRVADRALPLRTAVLPAGGFDLAPMTTTTSSRCNTVAGCDVQDLSSAMHTLDEISASARHCVRPARRTFADKFRSRSDAVGTNGVLAIGRIDTRRLRLDPKLGVQRRGLLLAGQYRAASARGRSYEPDHAKGTEHVSQSVRNRDVTRQQLALIQTAARGS